MKKEIMTAGDRGVLPGNDRADLEATILHLLHGLAGQFQAAGDPGREAQLRAWRLLRRAVPFSRLDELPTSQFRQAIAFLGEQIGQFPLVAGKGESQRERETRDAGIN